MPSCRQRGAAAAPRTARRRRTRRREPSSDPRRDRRTGRPPELPGRAGWSWSRRPEPQSSEAAKTPSGATTARRYENRGRSAKSSTIEWRAVPAVAPMRTGVPVERVLVDHVEERLEQAAVRRGEDGSDGDDAVSRRHGGDGGLSAGDGNPVSRLSVMSCARSRSSTTVTSTSVAVLRRGSGRWPRPAGRRAGVSRRAG